jgi:YHS domain-containing protein
MTAMRDPVCGKLVTEETAQAVAEYQGQRYLFCSRGCRVAFEREPDICLAATGLQKVSDPQGIDRWACQRPDAPENQNPERTRSP